jgi:hypothetical protein
MPRSKKPARGARQRAWFRILLCVVCYFAAPDMAACALCAWW